MPMYENNDGRTAAMWTGTTIVTIGFLVGTVALTIAQPWLFFVGLALIPIGGLVGKWMAMAGMGQPQSADAKHAEEAERRFDTEAEKLSDREGDRARDSLSRAENDIEEAKKIADEAAAATSDPAST